MSIVPSKRRKLRHNEYSKRKRSSTNWFDLPFEMRQMVIDVMDPKTRCKFAQCSKLCEKEAKESNNYLPYLEIECLPRFGYFLKLNHTNSMENAYYLKFEELENEQTKVVFQRSPYHSHGITRKIETGSQREVITKYARQYIDKYKKSIKEFKFKNFCLPDFNVDRLNLVDLRRLEVFIHISIPDQSEMYNNSYPIDFNQLLNFNNIVVFNYNYTFNQIVNFSGMSAYFESIEFTGENIQNYLKMWKNEEVHGNVVCVIIRLQQNIDENSTSFDWQRIIQGLDVLKYRESRSECEFYFKTYRNKKLRVRFRSKYMTVFWNRYD